MAEHIETGAHGHRFNSEKKFAEKKTAWVVAITVLTMFAEIAGGWYFNSMALFSDGWHMATHTVALGISLMAYILARKMSCDKSFAFGTWKIEILGSYTSSIILGITGFFILAVSFSRLLNPLPIDYYSALTVAVVGMVVNIICAFILQSKHGHGHLHSHGGAHTHKNSDISDHCHEHEHEHEDGGDIKSDLNLKSAYYHVLADALTSILAILALMGAACCGWNWLDPAMGILGSLLIFRWAYKIGGEAIKILLDKEMNRPEVLKIKKLVEEGGDASLCDLHLWRVSEDKYACILAIE